MIAIFNCLQVQTEYLPYNTFINIQYTSRIFVYKKSAKKPVDCIWYGQDVCGNVLSSAYAFVLSLFYILSVYNKIVIINILKISEC